MPNGLGGDCFVSRVPFCIWQAGGRIGAELVKEPNTWTMGSLHTADIERAEAFYGAVFGWKLESVPGVPFSQCRPRTRSWPW